MSIGEAILEQNKTMSLIFAAHFENTQFYDAEIGAMKGTLISNLCFVILMIYGVLVTSLFMQSEKRATIIVFFGGFCMRDRPNDGKLPADEQLVNKHTKMTSRDVCIISRKK